MTLRRLRPSQGGRFMRPVSPAPDIVAQVRALAPEEENYLHTFAPPIALGEPTVAVFPQGFNVKYYTYTGKGEYQEIPKNDCVGVITDKPATCTFAELAVGERFTWDDAGKDSDLVAYRVKTYEQAWELHYKNDRNPVEAWNLSELDRGPNAKIRRLP